MPGFGKDVNAGLSEGKDLMKKQYFTADVDPKPNKVQKRNPEHEEQKCKVPGNACFHFLEELKKSNSGKNMRENKQISQ